jgi:hypothetical protein
MENDKGVQNFGQEAFKTDFLEGMEGDGCIILKAVIREIGYVYSSD